MKSPWVDLAVFFLLAHWSFVLCNWKEDVTSIRILRLPVREGVHVGYERDIDLQVGRKSRIKTLSLNPLIFEVPNFLTDEECEYLILSAQRMGLVESPTLPEGNPMPKESTKDIFEQWDANNNGFLEPIEGWSSLGMAAEVKLAAKRESWCVIYVKERLKGPMQFLNKFTYIEGKGDLYLSADDISEMFHTLEMDKDKDGHISWEEFHTFPLLRIQNYFDALRRNSPHLLSRRSNQSWLWHYGGYDELPKNFHERLSQLTLLPRRVIERSEPLQVVSYEGKGHYQCHHDSDELESNLPCCTYERQFQTPCRLCRYLTVMYFLSNVEEGGQTAFPVANNKTFDYESWSLEAPTKCDLARRCHASNLIIHPRKGTALLWYNHKVRDNDGWLGDLDPTSYHGGCEVLKGTKWIANNWINVVGRRDSGDFYYGWLGKAFEGTHDEF